ncbi:t-SNARE domain-containing protein 1-like [Latimeria chalumnae]|uniref:t-SNARE domain-containing protein 1-like n=1 Tax=Latimeria chalumnae TaxID=7897 RepID=UPI00313BAC06
MEPRKATQKSSRTHSQGEREQQQQQEAGEPQPDKGTTGPRTRKRRFSCEEVERIVEGVDWATNVLLGTGTTSLAQKDQQWQRITNQVNALGYCRCGVTEVKHKWRDLRMTVKKKMANIARAKRATGGGPPPAGLTLLEEVISKHISAVEVQGIPEGQDTIDCK